MSGRASASIEVNRLSSRLHSAGDLFRGNAGAIEKNFENSIFFLTTSHRCFERNRGRGPECPPHFAQLDYTSRKGSRKLESHLGP